MNKWADKNIPKDIIDIVCRINILLDDKNVAAHDAMAQLDINYDALEEELETSPSVYAYWSFILAEAESQISIIERTVKHMRGLLYTSLNEEFEKKSKAAGTSEKLTQWQAKELVEADESLNREEMKLILAKRNYSKIRAIVESVKMKSDHLRSLSGFKRQEKTNIR